MLNFIAEKGICLPTIMLWLLFVYVEAAVRLRDVRHMPFHLDLCRPFAAHWYIYFKNLCLNAKNFNYDDDSSVLKIGRIQQN